MIFVKSSRKYFLLLAGFLIVISSGGWRYINSDQPVTSKKKGFDPGGEKKMEEVFKNIKVMNGQPASQLGPAMHFFEAALGFNCGNCHVMDDSHKWSFEKDDKPEKKRTRDMIVMMNAINKENFKGEQLVTCFTCHKGSPDPTAVPVVQTVLSSKERRNGQDEDEVIKVPNRLGSAEEIIAKYQEAIGGKEAFEKLTSLKIEGKVDAGNGRESSMTIYEKAPYFYYSETKAQQGTMQRGFNGESGWFKSPQFQRKLEGDDLADLKLSSDFYSPLNFNKNYSGLKLDNVQVIDNDTVYAVDGTSSKYRSFKFFFDVKTGLLLRQIQYSKTLFGDLQIQTDYKDYRSVNGVLFPFEQEVADYEHIQKFKFDSITPNVTIDEKIFDMAGK